MFKVGNVYSTTAPDGRTALIVHICNSGRVAYVSTSKAGAEYASMCHADGSEFEHGKPFLIAPDVTEDFFV